MNNDDISVILAVFNGGKYLTAQLDSIIQQADVRIREIIIVDDRSSDNSAAILNSYKTRHPYIKIITNEKNEGPISSFVKGAKSASANYISFADQDDIWVENKLALSLQLIRQIEDRDKPTVIFTDLKMIDEQNHPVHHSFWGLYHIKPSENIFFTLLFANIATGCTMLINRQMLNEFVKMPLNAQMHDHWIMLIASSIGTWGHLNEKTVLYRVHQNSVTNKGKVTLRKVIANFIEASFNKKSAFLIKYIEQAALFKERYQHLLNGQKQAQLDYFISLNNKPGIFKKLNSKFRFVIGKYIKFN